MSERKSSNEIPPVIYMHQVWYGEELEEPPVLIKRTPDALIATLVHFPEKKGSVCIHYSRSSLNQEEITWIYRYYPTSGEAETFFENVLLEDWNDEQGNEIRPKQWYTAQIENTDVVNLTHPIVENIEEDVLDPIQQAMDMADKYALEEIIDRLKQEGIDI